MVAQSRAAISGCLALGLACVTGCGGSGPTGPGGSGFTPDPSRSVLEAPDSVLMPGDTMTVTVHLRDAGGHPIAQGGAAVTLTVEGGTSTAAIGAVVDGGDGSYRGILTAQVGGTQSRVQATLNGTPVLATAPLRIATFETISAAWEHTCAILTGGIALCWGNNSLGQLGDGSKADSPLPRRVTGGLRFSVVGTGSLGQTCGLAIGESAYCWGNSGAGALGNGVPDIGSITNLDAPSLVAGGHGFARLAVGDGLAACGVAFGGAVLCWGSNSFGVLGDGTLNSHNVPTPVLGQPSLLQIGMGQTHTCGATAAGAFLCWGSDNFGELGVDPSQVSQACNGNYCSDTLVTAAAGAPLDPATLAVGTVHACALTNTGAAYCWGLGSSGELGDGVTTSYSVVPVAVAGGHQFARLALSNGDTCGITTDGSAYCWGGNSSGRLGSSPGDAATPRLVQGGLHFVWLDLGEAHTCGVATDGWAYCWGDNTWGQLGDGAFDSHPVPVRVKASLR